MNRPFSPPTCVSHCPESPAEMARIKIAPPLRSLAAALAVALVAAGVVVGVTRATSAQSASVPYCALLPDSVGLYPGNPVTQMGFEIGTVNTISTVDATSVRVDFSVTDDRSLPADVRSIIRSTSILADRSLELVGNFEGGPVLQSGECTPLDRSATPKSISQIVASASDFVDEITPADSQNLTDAITGLDKILAGNGRDVNQLLTRAGQLMNSPDRAVADIAGIVSNVAQLTSMLNANTGPLKEIITALPATTSDITGALWGTTDLVDSLPGIIVLVNDLERRLGDQTQLVLDTLPTVISMAASRSTDIAAALDPLPGLIGLAAGATRADGRITVDYRAPRVRVTTPDPVALCHRFNRTMARSCSPVDGAGRIVDVSLLQLVFAETGTP